MRQIGAVAAKSFFTQFLHLYDLLTCTDEVNTDKKIGFFKGLKETISFKPYFLLLMIELFAWLSVQVSYHIIACT